MSFVTTILIYVLSILGVALFGYWGLSDRSLSWTFGVTATFFIATVLAYGDNWIYFSTLLFCTIAFAHLYIYDRIMIKKSNWGGRR